jgi:hypothetical protein
MRKKSNDEGSRVTRNDLRRITRRAAELDLARQDLLTESEVREIASELGISESAVVRAMEEEVTHHASSNLTDRVRTGHARLMLIAGLPGFALGTLVTVVSKAASSVAGPWVLGSVAAVIALSVYGEKPQRRFQVRNAAFWIGLAATWCVVFGVPGDLFQVVAGWGAVTSVLGGIVVWARNKLSRGSPNPANAVWSGGVPGTRDISERQDGEDTGKALCESHPAAMSRRMERAVLTPA